MKALFELFGMLLFVAVWAVLAVLFFLSPFAVVWALNVLFATGIVYTFNSWLAVVVLGMGLSTACGIVYVRNVNKLK